MVTFSEFTTRLSRLGSVATDDGGFLQQLGAALVDRGKVKTWEKPAATGAQKRAAQEETGLASAAIGKGIEADEWIPSTYTPNFSTAAEEAPR